MKLFRRFSALTMVLVLLLSLSISVWAVDYDAANIGDLDAAFSDTSGEDVNINLTADIDAGNVSYCLQEGITYNIGSETGNTVGNIGFGGEDSTVVVDTEVNGDLFAYENADVTVTGNVNGFAQASGDSSLTVEGNVDGSVAANENADVTVGGNVTGYADAFGDSSVTVEGNVGNGVYANGNSTLTVEGNVDNSVRATDDASVTVGGDVTGADGNPDDVDYSDPSGFSDGQPGIMADGNATVEVGGNVTGGDSYGTFGYAGSGMDVIGNATVTVDGNVTGGNVTADPSTVTDEYQSLGGTAIRMENTATVNVGGNVSGGSTNGSNGYAGNGVAIYASQEGEPGSVTVSGDVTTGSGEHDGSGIYLENDPEADVEFPEISVGSADSIDGNGFTEEELEAIKSEIESSYTKVYTSEDFYTDVLCLIKNAKAGDEITVNFGYISSIPVSIIEAVRECDVTLVIQWAGGDNLVIDKGFTAELEGTVVELTKLADLLK